MCTHYNYVYPWYVFLFPSLAQTCHWASEAKRKCHKSKRGRLKDCIMFAAHLNSRRSDPTKNMLTCFETTPYCPVSPNRSGQNNCEPQSSCSSCPRPRNASSWVAFRSCRCR